MRVVYKPWIMKAINKLRMDAMAEAKEIEKIVLTKAESEQLRQETCAHMNPMEWHRNWYGPTGYDLTKDQHVPRTLEVYGIKVEVE